MVADRTSKPMTLHQYRAMADFRYELRRFLRYSENLTRRHGVTPLQYQMLLQVKGYPPGEHATVGELTHKGERLVERLARLHRNELLTIQGRLSLPELQDAG
jgi:hypothetical protein